MIKACFNVLNALSVANEFSVASEYIAIAKSCFITSGDWGHLWLPKDLEKYHATDLDQSMFDAVFHGKQRNISLVMVQCDSVCHGIIRQTIGVRFKSYSVCQVIYVSLRYTFFFHFNTHSFCISSFHFKQSIMAGPYGPSYLWNIKPPVAECQIFGESQRFLGLHYLRNVVIFLKC